jgi:hypothetical protein
MRIFLIILTILWSLFWAFVGIGIFLGTPGQIAKDKDFVDTQLIPCVDFVENFETQNNRLPNYREFYIWERDYFKDYASDLTQKVDSLIPGMGHIQYIRSGYRILYNDLYKFEDANWEIDYAIAIWRGEWTEYYFSWNNNYDTNNYSWSDGFSTLLIMIGIGFFPLVFWWLNYRKRKITT